MLGGFGKTTSTKNGALFKLPLDSMINLSVSAMKWHGRVVLDLELRRDLSLIVYKSFVLTTNG